MEILENYKQAISEIIEYQKHLANEITEIKTAIMDELINPIKDEYAQFEHDTALSDFRCKYAEKLDGFNDKLKTLEGEDFDIVEKAFDDFNARTDGMGEDEYVEKLASHIQEQLNKIGEAFGVKPEEIEEVKVETSDGEEVKAEVEDGQVVEVEKESEEKVEETTTDETEKEVEEETTADVEPTEEELSEEEENARHMAELEEEKKREGIE